MGIWIGAGLVLVLVPVGALMLRRNKGFQDRDRHLQVVFSFNESAHDDDEEFITELRMPTRDELEELGLDSPPERVVHTQPGPATAPAVHARPQQSPAEHAAPHPGGVIQFDTNGQNAEHTLQLLPGRLEIISGMDGGDIRFVKLPGQDQSITFGRGAGPEHRHIQLRSGTVSRMHARMRYQDGRWILTNLSSTNPVIVNGRGATADGAECLLTDGDRIEMGDVMLLFRRK